MNGRTQEKNDLQHIMHVFNSIEFVHMPTYVARDLSNLPPLSAYDTDVVGLHRDVQELKGSMRLVLESKVEIKSLTQTLNDKLATVSDDTLQVPQKCGPSSTSTQSPVATSEGHHNPAQDSIVSITTLDSSSEEDETLAKTHSDEEHSSNLTSTSEISRMLHHGLQGDLFNPSQYHSGHNWQRHWGHSAARCVNMEDSKYFSQIKVSNKHI